MKCDSFVKRGNVETHVANLNPGRSEGLLRVNPRLERGIGLGALPRRVLLRSFLQLPDDFRGELLRDLVHQPRGQFPPGISLGDVTEEAALSARPENEPSDYGNPSGSKERRTPQRLSFRVEIPEMLAYYVVNSCRVV